MRNFLFSIAALGLLASCAAVGPNYSGPPQVASHAAHVEAFVRAGDLPPAASPPIARWWETLNDPTLDTLVTRAYAANASVAVASAKLRQARAALRTQVANHMPSGSATGLYAHARLPPLDLGQTGAAGATQIDLSDASFDASWEIDVFGGQRRAIEAARADAEGAAAKLLDAQVTLSAEVANAYVNLRDRQQRIALNQRSVDMQEHMLALTRQRYARGTVSKLDVARVENQLESTRANITPLLAERDAYLDELATLLGAEPGALDDELHVAAPVPLPPAQVAIGDPAALLQRRPDIRAAERTLAADTARIGQAQAAKFPSVKLFGILGVGGTQASDLTHLDDFTALIAPQISWSFLDFGRTAARVEETEGVRDEAEANYRRQVLDALHDAEDSLSRFRNGRITVATLARARALADEAGFLSEQRYRSGTITLSDLLDVQRQSISAEQSLSQGKAQLTKDFVAIQKALGLGWSE